MGCAQAQVMALSMIYRHAKILLCYFHMCKAFRKKVNASENIVRIYLDPAAIEQVILLSTSANGMCLLNVRCVALTIVHDLFHIWTSASQFIWQKQLFWMDMWDTDHNVLAMALGNCTNKCLESTSQIKRVLVRRDALHMSVVRVY